MPNSLARARGRGAVSNRAGRFEAHSTEDFWDGWTTHDDCPAPLRTSATPEKPRNIITRNRSPDVGFDRSINPYRGCEHGCIYCYARPAHAYMGLSPGLDFESRLFFKTGAAAVLRREISAKGYKVGPIHIGGNTDPYQPLERRMRVTRQVLEVLAQHRHPFSIITKSTLIARDLDLIGPMGVANLARAAVSVTTLDRSLARAMEPRAATPARRLDTIAALARAGVATTVMFAPVIPGLNDHDLEPVLKAAAEAGATSAGYVALRLPLEIKDLFAEWLAASRPERAERVMSLVRQMRGGREYDSRWNVRMKGDGPVAQMIGRRFSIARRRFGLDGPAPALDCSQFRIAAGEDRQADLFVPTPA